MRTFVEQLSYRFPEIRPELIKGQGVQDLEPFGIHLLIQEAEIARIKRYTLYRLSQPSAKIRGQLWLTGIPIL